MASSLRLGRILLLAVAGGIYLLLAHLTTAPGAPSTPGALVAVTPYMAIALGMAWKSRARLLALALWGSLALLLWYGWPVIKSRFEWIYLIQHVSIFSLLAIGFARSLAAGADPMITRFARLIHGEQLDPAVYRYTRQVTLAWTLFFAALAAASAGLFFFGPFAFWSLLVNLLTPALIGLMFAAEYLVRVLVLPRGVRTSLADSVRACMRASRRLTPPVA